MTVTAPAEAVLSRIVALVGEAQGAKLPVRAAVDGATGVIVPVAIGPALATVAAWLVVDPAPALVAAVPVPVATCPCAIGLAAPTSIMVGTGRATGLGVPFRRGDAPQACGSPGSGGMARPRRARARTGSAGPA